MIEIETFEERRCCVRKHPGGLHTVDETRRPMYQHMISHELVGGASMLRFDEGHEDSSVDVLIGATCDFDGDDVVTVEIVPAGRFAVWDYIGPEEGLAEARRKFIEETRSLNPVGRLYQVHLMDAIDGEIEQSFQIRLE